MTIPKIASYPMPAAAQMPDNRVAWTPDPRRAALLIHDMQQYFLDFYDGAAEPIPTLIAHVAALRDACDAAGVPVFYTAQPAEQSLEQRGLLQEWWGPGLTAQPHRAAVVEPLAPRATDTVLTKWRYSAFARSDLREQLRQRGRDQLIVCGVYAHIGCTITAADAFMQDVQAFLVGDAVADFSAAEHAFALDYVSRRCGVATTTQRVVAALSGDARVPASLDELRLDIARIVQIKPIELAAQHSPFDAGLDSIRLMTLIEQWRRAGCAVDFVDLVSRPTLHDWWTLIDARRAA